MVDWITSCNINEYDVDGAFKKLEKLNWKQSTNIEVGDTVYIYVGAPVQAIRYKCLATKVNLEETEIVDLEFVIDSSNYVKHGRYMELQLIETYKNPLLNRNLLMENGLKSVQGPSRVNEELAAYILASTESIGSSKIRKVNPTVSPVPEDSEIEVLLSGRLDEVIDVLIKQFIQNIPKVQSNEQELEVLRVKFVEDYKIQSIINMKKENYVVGLGRKDTFCYRIENELQGLGNIHGAPSTKFGLYYGKSGEDTEEKYRNTKKYGDDPERAFEKIKEEIVMLLIAGQNKDFNAIRSSVLPPLFRGKILAIYFPEDYLCIFSDDHLEYFMMKLGIDMNLEDDTIDKQCKLLEWKASRHELKDWNTHLFSNFLYTSFGRPFEENKKLKDLQDERDKNYPRDYVSKLGINVSMWKDLIQKPNVFTEADVAFMKRLYVADNHAATCNDLGIQDGVSSSSYITPVVSLAKRVVEEANIQPIYGTDGKRTWWRILFWGSYKEDGHFEWKLRPKLAKALASIYPELDNIRNVEIEEQEDYNLVEELKQASLSGAEGGFQYAGKPKKKQPPTYTNGHRTYPRDRQTAINALTHAHYECEIDIDHPSFIRKKSDKKYTEPHHLVPMAYSDKFDVCLDVEENIVSLCSNCHNQIHYGRDAKDLLEQLYEERKLALKSVGIVITLEQLISMYSVVF
ncbi:HNH endonuclease [Clostridium grantii]|uniref:Predicted restriction endonuclease, HNH family n=1 Tax=Clostridium grantii DSM 8605 TaxID=1121316 RepID=A0A1M5RE74_9CLOT|nr:hypothetical protein [Clostridium grantii]SHH24123.1 Predicted restriction endonuclease, HNH family [Clostridium grantii DSM 8605]